MSPYQVLRRYAAAIKQRLPEATAEASFLSGFELGMKMSRLFPISADKLIESIDIEAHKGDNQSGVDTLVAIVNDMAQQRPN